MNFSRSLARSLLSSSPKRWPVLLPIVQLQSSSLSSQFAPTRRTYETTTRPSDLEIQEDLGFPLKSPTDLPRPSEIPFQSKVANLVHLVGTIGVPVQLQTSQAGIYGVSVLIQEKRERFPKLWIPIIFQGDLAEIAAFHLKESDLVYVTGQLSGDMPSSTTEDIQTNIQVLAHSLNFVQTTRPDNEGHLHKQDKLIVDYSAEVGADPPNLHLWNDLLANPDNWWDNRSNKSNPAQGAFKHKDSGQLLWINASTPEWVRSKLDTLSFGQKSLKKSEKSESLWSDLVDFPQQWSDYRIDKKNGLVNPKYPDFKHKSTQKALWLDSAPDWLLTKLNGLVFDRNNDIAKRQKDDNVVLTQKSEKENLWKDLVENPKMWWDNRSNKLKPKSPDFKCKVTGKGLWLDSSTPSWVLPKLPPVNNKQDIGHKQATSETGSILT